MFFVCGVTRVCGGTCILQESTGLLSAAQVCETCFQYNLPLTTNQLSLLVRWCGSEGGGGERVRYRDLVELINWQHEIPADLESTVQQRSLVPGEMSYRTTYIHICLMFSYR